MIFSKGFCYRFGVSLKDFGERMAHARVFGAPALRWACGPVIKLGLGLKAKALDCPISELK